MSTEDNNYRGSEDRGGNQPTDPFDRKHWLLRGIPGVLSTKPSNVHVVPDGVERVETFTVQTFRQKDGKKSWDTIFLQRVSDKIDRIILPDSVVNIILRQHAALTDKARSEAAKVKARERKEAGVVPFQKKG